MEAIISEYLKHTKSPNFNDFVGKNKQNIINLSTTTNLANAFKLMTLWINKYNGTAIKICPTTRLQKKLNKTTIAFKGIYSITCAQATADQIIGADSYKTSTAYTLKANKALRHSTNINQLDNNAGQSSVRQDNASDEVEDEDEDEDEDEGEDEQDEDEDEQDEGEDEQDEGEDEQDEGEDEQDEDEKDVEDIREQLVESLTDKLNGKPYKPITYFAQDKHNLAHLLLQEASEISKAKEVSGADLEFWKLAVSSTINLMNPTFETRLSTLLTEQQLHAIKDHMNDQKTAFQNTKILSSELIDSLFDSLQLYQFDTDTDGVIDFIDGEKYKEKDKNSEHYKLLKLIWMIIINFERLRTPNATEALFSSSFELLLSILFQGHDISVESGETVSEATSRAAAVNERSISDFGRRIDILIHDSCYGIRNEYCCIEFKRQDAATSLLTRQQSKSIRINGAILNDLRAKTKTDDIYLIYMEFWGVDGYISGSKRFEDVNLVDQISPIHLPVSLVELEDFRTTIKYLYQWRQHVLYQSRKLALGVFREKRKYEAVDISRPSTPIRLSPGRELPNEPLKIYYSPSKNKRTKGN